MVQKHHGEKSKIWGLWTVDIYLAEGTGLVALLDHERVVITDDQPIEM